MQTLLVSDFKTHFSEIIERVRKGEKIAIAYGKKKEIVAFIVPSKSVSKQKRPLGLLNGKMKATFSEDFKMTEEELIGR